MEISQIKRYSYYVFVGTIILMIIKIFNLLITDESFLTRKIQFITGYFITLPIIFVSLILTIIVLFYYISRKFKPPIKYLMMIIPFLIFMIWIIPMLV